MQLLETVCSSGLIAQSYSFKNLNIILKIGWILVMLPSLWFSLPYFFKFLSMFMNKVDLSWSSGIILSAVDQPVHSLSSIYNFNSPCHGRSPSPSLWVWSGTHLGAIFLPLFLNKLLAKLWLWLSSAFKDSCTKSLVLMWQCLNGKNLKRWNLVEENQLIVGRGYCWSHKVSSLLQESLVIKQPSFSFILSNVKYIYKQKQNSGIII